MSLCLHYLIQVCRRISDKSTICKGVTSSTYYLAAFPYDCRKFVNCTKSGGFVAVKTVTNNMVYNHENGQATDTNELPCAVTVGKYINVSD